MAHKAGRLFDDEMFDGDVNAIVDFKYSPNPRLTWWFDHHQSAFLEPADEEHFRRDTSGRKFLDPQPLLHEVIARVAGEKSATVRRISTNWCAGPTSSTAPNTRMPPRPSNWAPRR